MIDWTASMKQTFEFYVVDPGTWGDAEKLDIITSGSIVRDEESDSLGSASFSATEMIDECYIRVYLVAIQNGEKYRFPLGTYLCQTPGSKFDGRVTEISIQAYTPLIELKEKCPPIGYAVARNRPIVEVAGKLTSENLRAPVVESSGSVKLLDPFVANLNDTWLTFITDLLANADYHLDLDELGQVLFAPYYDLASMQPFWTFDDGNSSILQPSVSLDRDLYNMPNVVEVIYSNENRSMYARVVNNDPDSPISTVNRGREIVYRETDPDLYEGITQGQLNAYAKKVLRSKSSLEYTITYTHGYCPVRIGDCVTLNYQNAGLNNVKARVTRQSIRLEPGCQVDETAVYSTNLWGG